MDRLWQNNAKMSEEGGVIASIAGNPLEGFAVFFPLGEGATQCDAAQPHLVRCRFLERFCDAMRI